MRKEDELLLQGTSAETPKYRDANPISRVIVIRTKNEWDLKKGPAFRKVIENGGPSLRMGSPCADYRVAEQANKFMPAYAGANANYWSMLGTSEFKSSLGTSWQTRTRTCLTLLLALLRRCIFNVDFKD